MLFWLFPKTVREVYQFFSSHSYSATFFLFFFFFWPRCAACGILVPPPEIKPGSPALEAWSPNHWTAREFPETLLFAILHKKKYSEVKKVPWTESQESLVFPLAKLVTLNK